MTAQSEDRIYFRQLLSGREFARVHPVAAQMVNFAYLIGDREAGECMAVDPAWDVTGLVQIAGEDGMKLTGALATHYHPDHIGGDLFGTPVEGLSRLLELCPLKVHVHREEAAGVKLLTGLSDSDLALHDGGDTIRVGELEITLLHTPGHTPGSQCFLVGNRLVSGDTLFVQGCGRVDLPGSDPEEMYRTLTTRLGSLPDDTVLYPGHHYGPAETSTLEEERRSNHYLRVPDLDTWLRLMG
jgi:glyoxylase-like metal-dependent hydrolase (beta-lactamase superfamily II)